MKKVFNTKEYAIYEMEDDGEDRKQYKIFIKEICKQQNYTAQIDRDLYSSLEKGLDYAKELAIDTITKYFITPQNGVEK